MTEHESEHVDDQTQEAPEAPSETSAAPSPDDAWTEVVQSVERLGKAVTAWGGSIKDDPRNRERAEQLKARLEGVGREIGDAVSDVAKSDVAQELGKAASSAGQALGEGARKLGEEVTPHIAGAFRSIAEGLKGAAERMERGGGPAAEEQAPGPHPSPAPAPYDGSEPPAPAESGIHEEG